jgi:hypothetical protein
MLKLLITLLLSLVISVTGNAQTGPGGVGTSDGTSNLSLWLNAGTITAVSNGSNITSWQDQSGNGNNAAVSTNPPDYAETGGGNGLPAVNFRQQDQEDFVVTSTPEVMPTSEISVFVAGNYENDSDSWGGMICSSDDDNWDDGWGICQDDNTGDMLFYLDDYEDDVCDKRIDSDYGTNHVWNLIFNTTENLGYGYKSEDACSFGFNGPLDYNGGANDDVLIGSAPDNGGPDYYLSGDIMEVIIYDVAVNDAQRIIIANYLAAKYAISLSNNDVYNEDDNGNYDFDVAGIGQAIDGTNHTDAQGTGIIRILNPSALGNDEFLMWGHNNGSAVATEIADVPASVDARFERVWRVSERNSANSSNVNVGTVDIRFDLSENGSISAADLVLLIDTDNDNTFADETAITGATSLGGGIYQFSTVPGGAAGIRNDRRFTIGTSNSSNTPLPITLVAFNAAGKENNTVELTWQTSSEINNDYFTIERMQDSVQWEKVIKINGAANSIVKINYSAVDDAPFSGLSYYRLKQTDFDGRVSYSTVKAVRIKFSNTVKIYPNPTQNRITVKGSETELSQFSIHNMVGQNVTAQTQRIRSGDSSLVIDLSRLANGVYFIKTRTTANKVHKR